MSAPDEDLKARLRELEQWRGTTGERLAKVEAAEELVRAVAPLVNDVATVRGMAESALSEAKEAKAEAKEAKNVLADSQSVARSNRWNLVTAALSLAALIVMFAGLIFVILQFAGAGAGGP